MLHQKPEDLPKPKEGSGVKVDQLKTKTFMVGKFNGGWATDRKSGEMTSKGKELLEAMMA